MTLQDRLVKELRLRDTSTQDAANAFAAEFMADYNRCFAKASRHDLGVHRRSMLTTTSTRYYLTRAALGLESANALVRSKAVITGRQQ